MRSRFHRFLSHNTGDLGGHVTRRSLTVRRYESPPHALDPYFINTLREVPADADVISQKLMMRAGMIRKVAAGIYTYLPLGLRAIQKLENIVREEMDRSRRRPSCSCPPSSRPSCGWSRAAGRSTGRSSCASRTATSRDFVLRADARGSHHRHRPRRDQLVPPAPGHPLPDPDEVPRRSPSALRPDARTRVHHEGRVLVPRQPRIAR